MDLKMEKRNWSFFIACLGLAILAELSFFHGRVGISYPIFISAFYIVVFLKYKFAFQHRRIGVLLMLVIWILAGNYVIYDSGFFYVLNALVIPFLVYFHIVLITSPNQLSWASREFVVVLKAKGSEGVKYSISFCKWVFKKIFRNMNEQTEYALKRILIGLVIGGPLLLIIIGLLMSADAVFEEFVLHFPRFITQFNFWDGLIRTALVVVITLLFFGIFQVLSTASKLEKRLSTSIDKKKRWDSLTVLTILVMLNAVYVLFAVIQFQYFFHDGLQEGYTYATYARRGFFELLFVTLLNWSILLSCLRLVESPSKVMKVTMKIMYSILIVVSGIMLASAYQRLSMYEAAYGYTLDRLLAHAVMIFLIVIFAYTLIHVWVESIALLHFYLIAGLIFYTALNVVNIERIIVDGNLERFKETEKIDLYYLNSLSYTGVDGLIELYEIDPNYPELEYMLVNRKYEVLNRSDETWQSFNFTKERVIEDLEELDL
ncbi:DUF4153 domain-containing protein [Oceanobacillus bengalensis]|uniref:DUF4173 domain-containing protein n=1 Tax=Oceanobacillus bengalensis TaxID=1435466 RepID=A0A494YTZ7_9BACI|nr:DUF4173 domain-containing protein [Oceanobacillus bengalensis]RKQ13620.1 DUF4173 domain-containing protein [Oceanobacillus bengalensis]